MNAENTSESAPERELKIEATGDVWHHGIKPKIRLCGLWLEKAGFKPGKRVRVISERPGELTLQAIEPIRIEQTTF